MSLQNLYHEKLLDHYNHPRNRGELKDATAASEMLNPSCGDEIKIQVQLDGNEIKHCMFVGKGCVISQAAASMLAESIQGRAIQDVIDLQAQWMLDLVGIQLGPTRARCALLALEALHKALQEK